MKSKARYKRGAMKGKEEGGRRWYCSKTESLCFNAGEAEYWKSVKIGRLEAPQCREGDKLVEETVIHGTKSIESVIKKGK